MPNPCRPLTSSEQAALESQHCRAESWVRVLVEHPFDSSLIRDTRFSGDITIGAGAVIDNSRVDSCTIGRGARIIDTRMLSKYDIGENCIIERNGSITFEGRSACGCGLDVRVVNEAGGREVPLSSELSAQTAYLIAMYRHDSSLVDRLRALVLACDSCVPRERGEFARATRVRDCVWIRNVRTGPFARLEGALRLDEGTIASCEEDPSVVGDGVIAREFVLLEGAHAESRAIITRSLLGQGVRAGRACAIEHSLLFANCEVHQGELCSVLAGPYTVTHHAGTLLIAGVYSFYNAGSATNHSNHRYKTGPVHQGVMSRGGKTGSGAYLLWPARIGVFSTVVGRHMAALDTRDLPFSLVREYDKHSELLPGIALTGCGLFRDERKWRDRDRRKAPRTLDIVDPEVFSPLSAQAMLAAEELLGRLALKGAGTREYVHTRGAAIKARILESCRRYYTFALDRYLGERLADRLAALESGAGLDAVRARLAPLGAEGAGVWVDLAGMLVPVDSLEETLAQVRKGSIATIAAFSDSLAALHERCADLRWNWCTRALERRIGVPIDTLTPTHIRDFVGRARDSAHELLGLIEMDLAKEFDGSSMVGYGLDGGEQERTDDFCAVRGAAQDHPLEKEFESERTRIDTSAAYVLSLL